MFTSLSVLAPGLLGGSVAQAVRSRGLAQRIAVWSRRAETRAALREVDWCDDVCDTPEAATVGSEFVVICAPVDRIVTLAEQIAGKLQPDAIVTDVGSVKSVICRHGAAALRNRARFVGSHPMAGSDRGGFAHANPDLFRGRPCFVTPLEDTDDDAVGRVITFWRALDADVITENPEKHDEIVAHISHLPHVVAAALCTFLSQRDPQWRDFASTGLRDTTRVARGDPELWRGILEQNREEVLRALRGLQDELEAFHAALANEDFFAIKRSLERGREYRDGLNA